MSGSAARFISGDRTVVSGDLERIGPLDRFAAADYVLSRRTPEGGYSYYRTPEWGIEEPNAPDTLAALESLRILGVDPPSADETVRWLLELQDGDGGYPSLTICWATLRALDLLGMRASRSPIAWLATIEPSSPSISGPRDLRGALGEAERYIEVIGLSGGEVRDSVRSVIRDLLAIASDPAGGWARPGPELETTAIACRLAEAADIAGTIAESTLRFLHRCEDPVLGLRLSPEGRATAIDAIWGGLVLYQMLGARPRFPGPIGTNLALLQRRDGGLGARHRAISTLAATWRGLEAEELLFDPKER